MKDPEIDKKGRQYELISRLSENDLCDSWKAKSVETGELCFLKRIRPDSSIDPALAASFFIRSFELQKTLCCPKFVTAQKRVTVDGVTCHIYPYYDSGVWTPLTDELLWLNHRTLLPQIAQLIDLLHLMGLVHGDIKIENFLVNLSVSEPLVYLSDFDFLTQAGSKPQGIMRGTQDHIAQEIFTNEGIYPQSDMYSLGKSLAKSLNAYLEKNPKQTALSFDRIKQLRQVINECCQENRYRRPRTLLDRFLAVENTTTREPVQERYTLLKLFLHARIRNASSSILTSRQKLARYARIKCRLFGLPEEILHILFETGKVSPAKAWRLFLNVLKQSEITQFGDFWNMTVPKSVLAQIITLHDTLFDRVNLAASVDSVRTNAMEIAVRARENGFFWHGLFVCETALTKSAGDTKSFSVTFQAPLLQECAVICQHLYLLDEAESFYAKIVSIPQLPLEIQLDTAISRAGVQIRLEKKPEAKTIIQDALSKATPEHLRQTLKLRQLLGWVEMTSSHQEQGLSLLEATLKEAQDNGFGKVIIQTLYSIGALYWIQGKFSDAIHYFEQSVKEATDRELQPDAMPSLAGLAFLHCERGNYGGGLHYARQFDNTMDPHEHHSLIPIVYLSTIFAHVRLARREKAEFWLQRYLEVGGTTVAAAHFHTYAQHQAFYKLAFGDIAGARQWGAQALQIGEQAVNRKTQGKVFQNLAEADLITGQLDSCLNHIDEGIKLFTAEKDTASIAEMELIRFVTQRLYSEIGTDAQLLAIIKRLETHNCTYYAALGYLYVMMLFPEQRNSEIAQAAQEAVAASDEEVPLFNALKKLSICYMQKNYSADSEIVAWKQAFMAFNQAEQRFLALLCCRELITFLKQNNRYRQAERYVTMTTALAEGLDNQPLLADMQADVMFTSRTNRQNGDLISIFHSISELMKNVTDHRQTLQLLLRFAVNQSGAERGVLFSHGSMPTGLRVIAFIGCDEQSQADAADFSKSIVNMSLDEVKPLVVDNAIDDPRTSRYRSIIKFNILSVVAIPLRLQNRIIGVLYLDHHVIPALFTEDDIRYIETIANFISQTLGTVQDVRVLRLERDQLAERMGVPHSKQRFLTCDPTMLKLLETLPRIAVSNACVLLLGESGTGKELIAEEIHRLSERSKAAFVRLNCAAIPPDLIEITLFGAIKGAATGINAQEGKLRAADEGSLFLDEIGDMELHVQAKILRAIEQQEFSPVGANRIIHTDIRFICATNRNLEQMVKEGKFRDDLYHRIAVIELEITPLRKRVNDIPLLIDHFLDIYGKEAPPQFTIEARTLLNCYTWPGNVRELRNFVERQCIMHPGELIDSDLLPPEMRDIASQRYTTQSKEALERQKLDEAKRKCGGNQSEMARMLGIPLSTLRRKLKKYGLL